MKSNHQSNERLTNVYMLIRQSSFWFYSRDFYVSFFAILTRIFFPIWFLMCCCFLHTQHDEISKMFGPPNFDAGKLLQSIQVRQLKFHFQSTAWDSRAEIHLFPDFGSHKYVFQFRARIPVWRFSRAPLYLLGQ